MTDRFSSYLRVHWPNILFVAIGLVFVVFFQLQRAPEIYGTPWGDEVCNNHVFLSAPSSLRELSRNVCYFFKPVADFAIKKWIWFQLFDPSEAGFSLVPWFYAGLSLLLVLLIPWTRYGEIRLMGVVLIGLCGLESKYSVEAQCYSFSSVLSWGAVLSFWGALSRLERGEIKASFWIFLVGLAFGLNSHFFAWPYVGAAALFYGAAFFRAAPTESKRIWLMLLALGTTTVVLTTVMINIYPLYSLIFAPPLPNEAFVPKWRMTWDVHMQHWGWARLPLPLYAAVSIFGLFHPERAKRFLGWMVAFATGPGLYLVHLVFMARSSFSMQERYLIAYVAPTIFLFLLGLESATLWLSRIHKNLGRSALIVGVFAILLYLVPYLRPLPEDAKTGWAALRSTPLNYSLVYDFYERVKSYRRPVLVLSNRCWLLPIPELYMRYLGTKPQEVEILNVAGCETSPSQRVVGIGSFLEKYGDKALILITFENRGLLPCSEKIPALFQETALDDGCNALYEAKDLAPWVRRQYDIPASVAGMAVEEVVKPHRFLRKVVAPIVYYFLPLALAGGFLFIFYFFRLRL